MMIKLQMGCICFNSAKHQVMISCIHVKVYNITKFMFVVYLSIFYKFLFQQFEPMDVVFAAVSGNAS